MAAAAPSSAARAQPGRAASCRRRPPTSTSAATVMTTAQRRLIVDLVAGRVGRDQEDDQAGDDPDRAQPLGAPGSLVVGDDDDAPG